MHISEGILSMPVWVAGYAGTAVLAAVTMRNLDMEEVPKISVITAVFFIASLIKIPVGVASIHLILNGLVGVVLGWRAFAAIMLGIILQAIIFGHGGITVIGVNSLMLGGGGLVGYIVWQQRHYFSFTKKIFVFGALAGAAGTIVSGVILALALITTGEEFTVIAGTVLTMHIPIMLIEAAVVGACAEFINKIKPDILAGQKRLQVTHRGE